MIKEFYKVSRTSKQKSSTKTNDSVLGCGHPFCCNLSRCVEINLVPTAPQIHSHILTSDEEEKDMGYRQVEFCCHGCGESVIVMMKGKDPPATSRIRDRFIREHKGCPDFLFKEWCPDIRTKTKVVDLRSGKDPTLDMPS